MQNNQIRSGDSISSLIPRAVMKVRLVFHALGTLTLILFKRILRLNLEYIPNYLTIEISAE